MRHDETTDLMHTLLSSLSVVAESDDPTRTRIGNTYRSGILLSAHLALSNENVRSRIDVCLEWYRAASEADEAASLGWLLAAIDARVDARDLRDWSLLRQILDDAQSVLSPTRH